METALLIILLTIALSSLTFIDRAVQHGAGRIVLLSALLLLLGSVSVLTSCSNDDGNNSWGGAKNR